MLYPDTPAVRSAALQAALQRSPATADDNIRFELDDVVLAWKSGRPVPGIWVIGLQGYARDGHKVGEIHELGFRISLAALARGMLAPSEIEVVGPSVNPAA